MPISFGLTCTCRLCTRFIGLYPMAERCHCCGIVGQHSRKNAEVCNEIHMELDEMHIDAIDDAQQAKIPFSYYSRF